MLAIPQAVMTATYKDPLVLSCVGEGKTYLADFQVPVSRVGG